MTQEESLICRETAPELIASIPLLPVEIWRTIIRLVVSNASITSDSLAVADFHDVNTKAVSQVCKTWNEVVQECAFESLSFVLGQPRYALPLPKSIMHPSGPLRYVRSLRVSYNFTLTPLKISYEPLATFLKLCSRLSTLDISFPHSSPRVFQSILSSCTSHLTTLHLRHAVLSGPLSHFLNSSLLPSIENLTLTSIKYPAPTCSDAIALPTLRTLKIEGDAGLDHMWTLPALTNLYFDQNFGLIDDVTLQKLSSNINRNTKHLSLHQSVSSFAAIASFFPVVESLSLALPPQTSWFADLPFSFDHLAAVTLITERRAEFFHDLDKFNDDGRRARIEGALKALGDEALFPSIRRILCLGFSLPVKEVWWTVFANQLASRSVELLEKDPVPTWF